MATESGSSDEQKTSLPKTSSNENDKKTAHLAKDQPVTKISRTAFLQRFFNQCKELCHLSDEEIAKILFEAKCTLSDVICLRYAHVTELFLINKVSRNTDYACLKLQLVRTFLRDWEDKYGSVNIDIDYRAVVDQVMSTLDVGNTKVLLKCAPDHASIIKQCISNILSMTAEPLNLEAVKIFVKNIVDLDILTEETANLIEEYVFQQANQDVVEIFFKYRIHVNIEQRFKINVLTALFGNCQVDIDFLKALRLHTDARGARGFTALHYAVQNNLINNVKLLLNRKADVNSTNYNNETPLILTMSGPRVNSTTNVNIVELLLQYGADPFYRFCTGESFYSLIKSSESPSKDLIYLLISSAEIWKQTSSAIRCYGDAFFDIEMFVETNEDFSNFYMTCREQFWFLKWYKINNDITLFRFMCERKNDLIKFQLIGKNELDKITHFVNYHKRRQSFASFYLNVLQEGVRQTRKLLRYKLIDPIPERIYEIIKISKP